MESAKEKTKSPANETEHNGEARSPLHEYSHKGRKAKTDRLSELEQEWDAERTLLLNAAVISLSGALLGAFVNKKWFLLTAACSLLMAEHAITGWSPSMALIKKLGKRSKEELTRERYGLKAMKGDFKNTTDSEKVWEATE